MIVPQFKKFECFGVSQIGYDAFECLTGDLVIGNVESLYFRAGLNQVSKIVFPAIVLFISEVVILDDKLSEGCIFGQCFEDMFESLSGNIVTFDFQNLDLSVVGDEFCEFLSALVSDEFVVEDEPGVIPEILKLGS